MIQTQEKYFDQLKRDLLRFFGKQNNVQIFIFGSSVRDNKFGDIDIGLMGKIEEKNTRAVKEFFEESNFPFLVDIINFNDVDEKFKQNVLNNKVIWIKH